MKSKKATKTPVKKKTREIKKQAKTAITDKHRLFAMHYALTENAEESANKAGFTNATARKKAYKWVGQSRQESFYPELWDLVQEIKETHIKPKIENQFNVTSDMVITELVKIGFSDVRKFFEGDNTLKNVSELDDNASACISSVEIEELYQFDPVKKEKVFTGYSKKLKMWDKKGALELLGKHLGIFKDGSALQLPPNVQLVVKSQGEAPHISDG